GLDHGRPARLHARRGQPRGEAEVSKAAGSVLGLAHARAPARAGADQMNVFHECLLNPTEDEAPFDHGLENLPLHRPTIERGVLALEREALDSNAPGPVEIEQHEARRSSLGEPARGQTEDLRWTRARGAHRLQECQMAIVYEFQRERQKSLEADDAGLG